MYKNIYYKIRDLMLIGTSSFKKNQSNKKALLQYIKFPKYVDMDYFKSRHNNRLTSFCIVNALLELGFSVDIIDLHDQLPANKNYDLYIGHGSNFASAVEKLNKKSISVLLLTGANPTYSNSAQLLAKNELIDRNNVDIPLYAENIVRYLDSNLKICDYALLIGNEWTKSTYVNTPVFNKLEIINNVTVIEPSIKNTRTNNFIFMSSIGQVHRGLDLVLDSFDENDYKLYVLSDFINEKEFLSYYHNHLFKSKNIIPVGMINLDSSNFKNLIEDVDFAILPSRSEGQSSSVINLMSLGIIPIVSKQCGISVDGFGFYLEDFSVKEVDRVINLATSMSSDEILRMRRKLFNACRQYKISFNIGEIKTKINKFYESRK